MRFITLNEIGKKQEQLVPDSEEEKVFGHPTNYFELLDNGNEVASFTALIAGWRRGEDPEGPFFVDLTMESPTEGVFIYLENINVVSMLMVDRKTGVESWNGLCPVGNYSAIQEIVNAPRYGDPLKVVVDNTKTD